MLKIMKTVKTLPFLYFIPETMEAVSVPPSGSSYESFVPSVDMSEGYIVVVECDTYDSEGPNGKNLEVIDLYPDYESARRVCLEISNARFKETDAKRADGSKVYTFWKNWGNSFSRCFLKKVVVKNDIDFEEFR